MPAPDPDAPLTVDAWVAKTKAEIDRFVAWWKRKAWADPDGFPDQMTPGDWDDHWNAVHGDWVDPEA